MTDQCYLCYRIPEVLVTETAKKLLPSDPKSLIADVADLIIKGYSMFPVAFCGKSAKRIVGGAFYITLRERGEQFTQKDVAGVVGCQEVTLRSGYHDWRKLLKIDLHNGKGFCLIDGKDHNWEIWDESHNPLCDYHEITEVCSKCNKRARMTRKIRGIMLDRVFVRRDDSIRRHKA